MLSPFQCVDALYCWEVNSRTISPPIYNSKDCEQSLYSRSKIKKKIRNWHMVIEYFPRTKDQTQLSLEMIETITWLDLVFTWHSWKNSSPMLFCSSTNIQQHGGLINWLWSSVANSLDFYDGFYKCLMVVVFSYPKGTLYGSVDQKVGFRCGKNFCLESWLGGLGQDSIFSLHYRIVEKINAVRNIKQFVRYEVP